MDKDMINEASRIVLDTRKLDAGDGSLFPLAFSRRGQFLACFGGDTATVWDTETATLAYRIDRKCSELPTFSFNDELIAACDSERVEVWRHPTGILECEFLIPDGRGSGFTGELINLSFDQSNSAIGLLSQRCWRSWGIANLESSIKKLPEDEIATHLRINESHALIYSCRLAGDIITHFCVTEYPSARRLIEISITTPIFTPIVSPNGNYIVIAVLDERKRYEVWDVSALRCLGELPETDVAISHRSVFVDDQRSVVATRSARVWDLRERKLLSRIDLSTDLWPRWSYSSETEILAAAVSDFDKGVDRVFFASASTGKMLAEATGHSGDTSCFSPCGRWYASVVDCNLVCDRPNYPYRCGTIFLTDVSKIVVSPTTTVPRRRRH